MSKSNKRSVLFLCTGNSCRSQMAEGWARHLLDRGIEPFSAGIEKRGLDPRAVKVMQEVGIDITAQQSNRVDELPSHDFDLVVTVCDDAKESCPALPGAPRQRHRAFDDPPKLALTARDESEALSHYRRVRDEIHEMVLQIPELMG